jgi:hypothetical protein
MVLIGYCIPEADRLGAPVLRFLESNGRDAFAVAAAYQEFESVMDGLDAPVAGSGLFEGLVSDLVMIAGLLDERPESPVETIISESGLPSEESDHVRRWAEIVLAGTRTGNGRGEKLRRTLVLWERKVAQRRAELRRRLPRWDPDDMLEASRVEEALARAWKGGRSWSWDRRIFAHTHCRACREETVFVSEDRQHFGKRRDRLLGMTKVKDILDLAGKPLTPQ